MKKQIKKYLTFFYKKEVETGDSISYDCHQDIFGKGFNNDGENHPEEIFIRNKSNWGFKVDHIKIDNVIKILQKLKKGGSNYVEILHHCDHRSYIFNGIEVRESTQKEIDDYNSNQLKIKEKQKRIEELKKEIQRVSKS